MERVACIYAYTSGLQDEMAGIRTKYLQNGENRQFILNDGQDNGGCQHDSYQGPDVSRIPSPRMTAALPKVLYNRICMREVQGGGEPTAYRK